MQTSLEQLPFRRGIKGDSQRRLVVLVVLSGMRLLFRSFLGASSVEAKSAKEESMFLQFARREPGKLRPTGDIILGFKMGLEQYSMIEMFRISKAFHWF